VVPCKEDYFHFLNKEPQLLEFASPCYLMWVPWPPGYDLSTDFTASFYDIKLRDWYLIAVEVCSFQVHGSITSGFKGHSRVALGIPSISSPLLSASSFRLSEYFSHSTLHQVSLCHFKSVSEGLCLHPASSIIWFCNR